MSMQSWFAIRPAFPLASSSSVSLRRLPFCIINALSIELAPSVREEEWNLSPKLFIHMFVHSQCVTRWMNSELRQFNSMLLMWKQPGVSERERDSWGSPREDKINYLKRAFRKSLRIRFFLSTTSSFSFPYSLGWQPNSTASKAIIFP